MEYLGTIYKGSQSDIIFPVPFIELSDGATVDFYTDGNGGFSRSKDEIKIDNYMLKTTASADELNSLNDGVLNYTINTCMGKSEGDTGLYLSEPTSYVDRQYLTADNVKTINGESIVGQGDIEIEGGGNEDYIWKWDLFFYTTGPTDFTEEEIQSVIDAYKNEKRIVIYSEYAQGYVYPSMIIFYKETELEINYLYNQNLYKFSYNSLDGSQSISKVDEEVYVWGWWRGQVPTLNGNTLFKIDDINKLKEAFSKKKIILINYINQYLWNVSTAFYSGNTISLVFYDNGARYRWYCKLSTDGTSIEEQTISYLILQERLSPKSQISIQNLNLKNNKDVDTILTNLQSSASTANEDIKTLSGNVKTAVEGYNKLDEMVGQNNTDIAHLQNSAATLSTDLITLSGSVQNNYYNKTEVDDKISNISGGSGDNKYRLNIDYQIGQTSGETTYTLEELKELYNALSNSKDLELYFPNTEMGLPYTIKPYDISYSSQDGGYGIVINYIYTVYFGGEYDLPFNYTLLLSFNNETISLQTFYSALIVKGEYGVNSRDLPITNLKNIGSIECETINIASGSLDTYIVEISDINNPRLLNDTQTAQLKEAILNKKIIIIKNGITKYISFQNYAQEDGEALWLRFLNNDTVYEWAKEDNVSLWVCNTTGLQHNIDGSTTLTAKTITTASGDVDTRIAEIDNKIPTKTSQLDNDSGYLTSVPEEYAKTADIEQTYLKKEDASTTYLSKDEATETYQPKGNYLTEHQSLEEYYTKTQCNNQFETMGYSYSKSESDTNYASKTDTYTKEEIDSKIGDINNILESI